LTTEPIQQAEDTRSILHAYARRWQVETAFRFGKSALGAESVRVRAWEHCIKLPSLLTLAYAFLVSVLITHHQDMSALLRLGCHRTGQHARAVVSSLYRLHAAVASLLTTAIPPPIGPLSLR
jgi:hypothetical protein